MVVLAVLALVAVLLTPSLMKVRSPGPEGNPGPDRIREFEWEPPMPTTFARLPGEFGLVGGDGISLGSFADVLEAALTKAGYAEKAYYSVPGGFALVCRMEQIDRDGVPLPPPHRWGEQEPGMQKFSLGEYLRSLFLAPAGHYRLLVFVVTDQAFGFEQRTVTKGDTAIWFREGVVGLPRQMSQRPTTPETKCFALIYEFLKADAKEPAAFVSNETVGALLQLQRGGVL